MAISGVSVYTRTTENSKRRYAQADHRKLYPDGTIFVLRYEVAGARKWETLKGSGLSVGSIRSWLHALLRLWCSARSSRGLLPFSASCRPRERECKAGA